MTRLSAILVLGGASLLFTPASASAQFGRPNFVAPGVGPIFLPAVNPFANPFQFVPRYQYQYSTQFSARTMLGGVSFSSNRFSYGIGYPSLGSGVYQSSPIAYARGGYAYGGTSVRPNLMYQAQRDLAYAQRVTSAGGSQYQQATGQGNTDKPVVAAKVENGSIPVEGAMKALAAVEPARIVSGEALNELLKEIVKAESKSGVRPSAYISSLLLDEMRFAGSNAADALNLVRRADNLDFPIAFNDAALKDSRTTLEQDFVAVTVAVQAGKAPEPGTLAKVQASLQRLQDASEPILKSLKEPEATAARGFLSQMANTLTALKAGEGNGLIDPKWTAEGTTVADLVKHMTRYKLQFGPAPASNEASYTTMYRNLTTYHFLLTQPKK